MGSGIWEIIKNLLPYLLELLKVVFKSPSTAKEELVKKIKEKQEQGK